MKSRLAYLVGVLVLLCLVAQLAYKLINVDKRSVRLKVELDKFDKNYVNAKLELDRLTQVLADKINTISQRDKQSMNNPNHTNEHSLPSSSIPVVSNSDIHPSKFHRFMLVSEITFDKLYIVSEKKRNDYKFIFGLPTIARPQNHKYLTETLKSLLKDPVSIQRLNILIIIYVADIDKDRCLEVTEIIRTNFGEFLSAGSIEILCPYASLYPSLADLPLTLGDPVDRIKWRSKQTLDFAFLMSYASTKGDYYLQLEDDIIASTGYTHIIANHVESVQDDNWLLIHFSALGFIGKLMRCDDLVSFAQYLLLYYANQPCDWLMNDYGRGIVCHLFMNQEECNKNLEKIYIQYSPSLFQHMGTISSLNGKIQNAKDPLYKEVPDPAFKNPGYSNPPAKIASNFSIYNFYTADKIYEGRDIFWSNSVHQGDEIVIEFKTPQELKGLIVRSGGTRDKLEHGVVQYQIKGDQFRLWCDFQKGEANCSFSSSILVSTLRISATKPQDSWLLISHLECVI